MSEVPTDEISLLQPMPQCDIIITSHNYGCFLAECLESVFRQPDSLRGRILVVDDCSTDNTADIASNYDVEYLHVAVRDPHLARAAGLSRSRSPLVLFLDADNKLATGYLQSCATLFAREPRLAIAYADLQEFGESSLLIAMPRSFDRAALSKRNFIDTGCVVRRESLEQANPFLERPCDHNGLEDWFMWRKVADSGHWTIKWQSIPLMYRRHALQRNRVRSDILRPTGRLYSADACLERIAFYCSAKLGKIVNSWNPGGNHESVFEGVSPRGTGGV